MTPTKDIQAPEEASSMRELRFDMKFLRFFPFFWGLQYFGHPGSRSGFLIRIQFHLPYSFESRYEILLISAQKPWIKKMKVSWFISSGFLVITLDTYTVISCHVLTNFCALRYL
jgi:hypothetical protein